jgi:iron complex outermembrane receptor protein
MAGLDVDTKPGVYLNATANYTDHISLSDAASEYASDFVLLGAKAGYRKSFVKIGGEIFGGIDNALDQKYSLFTLLCLFSAHISNFIFTRRHVLFLKMYN